MTLRPTDEQDRAQLLARIVSEDADLLTLRAQRRSISTSTI